MGMGIWGWRGEMGGRVVMELEIEGVISWMATIIDVVAESKSARARDNPGFISNFLFICVYIYIYPRW